MKELFSIAKEHIDQLNNIINIGLKSVEVSSLAREFIIEKKYLGFISIIFFNGFFPVF
jgi:hypothetical protein